MSSPVSRRENAPTPFTAVGPRHTSTDSEAPANTRERLAGLCEWAETNDPGSVDDYARLLAAVQPEINGLAGQYADNGIEEHGRAQVRGDQHLRMLTLIRWARARQPRAKAAARAAARFILSLCGDEPAACELQAAVASLAKESGEAITATVQALGGSDPVKLDAAEQELIDQLQAVTGALAAVRTLRGRR